MFILYYWLRFLPTLCSNFCTNFALKGRPNFRFLQSVQLSKSSKSSSFTSSAMLSVNFCGELTPHKKTSLVFLHKHHFLLQKNLNFSSILRNIRFPNWVSCLLQSIELHPQTQSQSIVVITSLEEEEEDDSFAVTYLIDSCGLSKEEAISASKKLKLVNRERADYVLTLFKKHGFTDTQISKIVRKRPSILKAKPEKTLLPKIEFFESIGITSTDLGKLISSDPTLLARSLNNQFIPTYNILKNVLNSSRNVTTALRRSSWIFLEDLSKSLIPNIEVLKEFGVAESRIIYHVTQFPASIIQKTDVFRETVIQVKKMGFDPLRTNFVLAVHVLSGTRKASWDQCCKTYTKWGWSNDDITFAFGKCPLCMTLSEEKINRVMNFLLNEMGCTTDEIIRAPHVLLYSLENRIIPRCSVVQLLLLKGLIKKRYKMISILTPTKKAFWDSFLTKYIDEVPELLEVYEGKLDILDL